MSKEEKCPKCREKALSLRSSCDDTRYQCESVEYFTGEFRQSDRCKITELTQRADSLLSCLGEAEERFRVAETRVKELESAIRAHRDQKADDRCWMDSVKLYETLGEAIPKDLNVVGDTEAMLDNCRRFINVQCQGGGPWKSYAELEQQLAAKDADIERLRAEVAACMPDHTAMNILRKRGISVQKLDRTRWQAFCDVQGHDSDAIADDPAAAIEAWEHEQKPEVNNAERT